MQFTKLFNSILDSTIWQESKETKLVWITMLAMCDKNGDIHASIPGLAVRSGVSIAECEEALHCLLSPDKYSRTKEDEGRRIVEVDGGWRLINHPKYRALLSAEERREYLAQKQREHRAKTVSTMSTPVNKCSDKSTMSTHTEADADTEALREREAFEKSRIPFLETRSTLFLEAWERWKVHSREKGKPINGMSEETQLQSLSSAYPEESEAINAIYFSIDKNWANLDLKNSHNRKDENTQAKSKPTNNDKFDAICKKAYGT